MDYSPQYKLLLLRYLRANGFDTAKTIQHILKNIAWRQEMGVNEIAEQLPEDILGCKMSELTAVFPHWQVRVFKVLKKYAHLLFCSYSFIDWVRQDRTSCFI